MLGPHAVQVQATSLRRLPLKLPARRLKLLRHPLPPPGKRQQVQVRVGALASQHVYELKTRVACSCILCRRLLQPCWEEELMKDHSA